MRQSKMTIKPRTPQLCRTRPERMSGFCGQQGALDNLRGPGNLHGVAVGMEAVTLNQAVSQPFLQEPVHAPLLVDTVAVVHAVVLGVTQSATPTGADDLADTGVVID